MTVERLISNTASAVLNPLILLLFAIALVYFLWGVYQFIKTESDDKRAEAKNKILYGLIGMFIMVSAFGLIEALLNSFNIDTGPLRDVKK
ncbi:MAG: hypothetical protein H7831_08115 [Magnetococcus sp. WYHC-3]